MAGSWSCLLLLKAAATVQALALATQTSEPQVRDCDFQDSTACHTQHGLDSLERSSKCECRPPSYRPLPFCFRTPCMFCLLPRFPLLPLLLFLPLPLQNSLQEQLCPTGLQCLAPNGVTRTCRPIGAADLAQDIAWELSTCRSTEGIGARQERLWIVDSKTDAYGAPSAC